MLFCEGNYCAACGRLWGEHVGTWVGQVATQRRVSLRFGMHWRVEEGSVREAWAIFDFPGFFKQLGKDFLRHSQEARPNASLTGGEFVGLLFEKSSPALPCKPSLPRLASHWLVCIVLRHRQQTIREQQTSVNGVMQRARHEDAGDCAGKVNTGTSQQSLGPGANGVCGGTSNV